MKCNRHICSGAYANNMKCIYTSVPGYIHICSEFTDMCNDVGSICRLQWICNGTHVQGGRHFCSGVFDSNVECMYKGSPGNTVGCSEFT